MLELTSGNELPCLWGTRCTTNWNALNSLPWYTNSKANSLPIPVLLLKTPVLQHQTPALGLSPAQSIPHLISSLNLDWTSLPSSQEKRGPCSKLNTMSWNHRPDPFGLAKSVSCVGLPFTSRPKAGSPWLEPTMKSVSGKSPHILS